ncbi:hypothetical protein BT69DRAFT_1299556 [Atractiella rhizophila]|nr:hypothetical protein BT69DRAFT_1299556 [Atractiella rhizophila]
MKGKVIGQGIAGRGIKELSLLQNIVSRGSGKKSMLNCSKTFFLQRSEVTECEEDREIDGVSDNEEGDQDEDEDEIREKKRRNQMWEGRHADKFHHLWNREVFPCDDARENGITLHDETADNKDILDGFGMDFTEERDHELQVSQFKTWQGSTHKHLCIAQHSVQYLPFLPNFYF